MDLVTSRSSAQRQQVIAAYKSNFGQVEESLSPTLFMTPFQQESNLCQCLMVSRARTAFHEMSFLQDLIDDLKYELTGKFERLIVSLMRTPAQHDAKEIHDAIKVRV